MKKDKDEFILIFEDGDPVRAGIAKSLLEEIGIDCMVKNEGVQNLFGLGSIGGINPLIGTVKIFIRPEDREEAEKLLDEMENKEIELQKEEKEMPGETSVDSSAKSKGFLTKLRQWLMG